MADLRDCFARHTALAEPDVTKGGVCSEQTVGGFDSRTSDVRLRESTAETTLRGGTA